MKCSAIIWLGFILLISYNSKVYSEEIQIAYLERPPYYYTENNMARGILNELTEEIFKSANIPFIWLSLPPKRIISIFENTETKICSPGWFLKEERMKFANFTLPIYQNSPLAILVLKRNKEAFNGIDSFSSLFKSRTLTMGTVATYRYSGYLDDMIRQYKPNQIKVYSSSTQLVKMISAGRISYMIISPEEVGVLIESTGMDIEQFDVLTFPDITVGNKRFLMCSKNVDISTMKKLNNAIEKIVDPAVWSE